MGGSTLSLAVVGCGSRIDDVVPASLDLVGTWPADARGTDRLGSLSRGRLDTGVERVTYRGGT